MISRRIRTSAIFITVFSLTLGCLSLDALAVTKPGAESNIAVEVDPTVLKASGSAGTVSTGSQTDAREDEEENKKNNPSEYDKVETNLAEDNLDQQNGEDEADEADEEIVWKEVHLKTAEDILKLSRDCRLDVYSSDKKVYLDNDIALQGVNFKGIPYFNGYFYGQNHTISNILISDERSYQGFFCVLGGNAMITDLNIEGRISPSGAQTIVGGIAGDNKGIISACSFNGVVSGEDYVGGLVGINELSGIIMESSSAGVISGTHFTGGIAGENMGNIIRCTNESGVNITNKDSALSVEDISVDSILATVGIGDVDKDEAEASAMINGVVDMGGIAGVSIGVIQYCSNKGDVGYTNVGYNVGGIAGRQSGYIYSCSNDGHILGRKDVGGIVGQAEPYVTIDFANDITSQLSDNIEKLHDILTVTLNDADGSSDAISARLSIIKNFTDQALGDTRFIENETIDWANGMVASANEAISRIDYIMDEAAKKDGVLDSTNAATSDAKNAMSEFKATVGDLDVAQYMTDSDRGDYEAAKKTLEEGAAEHAASEGKYYPTSYLYYVTYDRFNSSLDTAEANVKDVAYKKDGVVASPDSLFKSINQSATQPDNLSTKSDGDKIVYLRNNFAKESDPSSDDWSAKEGSWVRETAEGDKAFPNTDTSTEEAKKISDNDAKLLSMAASDARNMADKLADYDYNQKHGTDYNAAMTSAATTVKDLLEKYSPAMTDKTKADAQKAIGSLEKSMNNLHKAGEEAKSIITTLNGKGDITLPSFSAEYKAHANSLTNNIQGMSDNFGLLNSEMNGASDKLIHNLQGVNDQFNVIMQLFTDAVDGVLDNDYSNTYTDNSLEVCRSTTDATIDCCTNAGTVEGSIDVAGICGTMAIEYDFDLESDITGVRDAAMNKSYLTKCVLRDDINKGLVTARKNYAGGVCGLQEIGTIVGGQNYNTITSSTASYVGGIAGSSVSSIVNGYAKCSLSGNSYVGGIVGDGARIYDSFALVKIDDAKEWYGAIAGHADDDADIRNNFFVSDELAGIDRISYSGKAEPVSYMYISEVAEDMPSYFSNVYVNYMLDADPDDDDNDPILLKKEQYSFGQNISKNDYPQAPELDGYYVVWDIDEIESISNDEVVLASYVRNNTTLAGEIVRNSGQSAILADGKFKKEDRLNATLLVNESDALPDSCEYWEVEIPDDKQTSHIIRYMKADNMEDWPEIYVLRGGSWELLGNDEIESMGSYKTFMVEGNNVKLQMVYSEAKKQKIKNILMVLAIIAGAALLITIIILACKSRSKVRRNVKRRAQELKEKAEAREPAIKFIDESDLEDAKADEKDD